MSTLRTGTEDDLRVLIGRLIERQEVTNDWLGFINHRLESGAMFMTELRATDARLEGKLDAFLTRTRAPEPEAEHERPRGMAGSIIAVLKAGREFLEAVASLKELAIAVAIIVAATTAMTHPAELRELIASYVASGHEGRE